MNVVQVDIHVLELPGEDEASSRKKSATYIEEPTLGYFPDAKRKTNRGHASRAPSPDRTNRIKLFEPLRVKVGDTVRVLGCINEYTLKGGDGVRDVQCDLRQAGSIGELL